MTDPDRITTSVEIVTFAARRRAVMRRADRRLEITVRRAVKKAKRDEEWYRSIVNVAAQVARRVYRAEGAKRAAFLKQRMDEFKFDLERALKKTDREQKFDDADVDRITRWVSTAAVNVGTDASMEAKDRPGKVWVSMDDDRVRHSHVVADGQQRPVGKKFNVGGHWLRYPGDPLGPPQEILNCRCVLAPTLLPPGGTVTTAIDDPEIFADVTEDEEKVEPDDLELDDTQEMQPIPWHAVLAPEGVASGDGRMFLADSMRWRDLPLPLSWQKASASGHDGSVVVGRIDRIWREDGHLLGEGVFDSSDEADTVVGMIAEGFVRGVSVDVDDATMQIQDKDGKVVEAAEDVGDSVMAITDGRICGATIVTIPAFAEAVMHLGDHENALVAAVSEKPWDGSAGRFTPEQWKRACILHVCDGMEKSCHKLPIREPSGALSRAGVHAAAARFNQVDAPAGAKASAKSALRGAYRQLGEEVPDVLAAAEDTTPFDLASEELEQFRRGPGWVTNPKETRRLHAYWTTGVGGRSKIRWGQGGDFNRCRRELEKYVPRFVNQVCAQWHHDALGYWPSTHKKRLGHSLEDCVECETTALVAAVHLPPGEWFDNPTLPAPTPITVTDDGHVFGHVALFDTCHVGIGNSCVTAPRSRTGYAYFRTGNMRTTTGEVPVGQISLGGGHADLTMGYRPAVDHYDSTSAAVADVAAGEDDFGIWVAGAIRPGVSADDVRVLRASGLSGDWRSIGGNLELVAVLAVNVPGFPVPRFGLVAGAQSALVSAGYLKVHPTTLKELVDAAVDDRFATMARRERILSAQRRIGRDPESRTRARVEAARRMILSGSTEEK